MQESAPERTPVLSKAERLICKMSDDPKTIYE